MDVPGIRLTACALAVGGALLLLPPVGHAAQPFGSRLDREPANSGECVSLLTPCTIASFIHPSDPAGDPYSGGAPSDGVITKFRIRAYGNGNAPAEVTFRLADISLPDPGNAETALGTAAGTGPTVTIPEVTGAETPILDFPGRLPVKKGNHLAIDGTNVAATYNTSGDKFSYVFAPPLVPGQGPRGSTAATGELLVRAEIEPDADGDGFGDETQDQCPSQAATQGPCSTSTPGTGAVPVSGVQPSGLRVSGLQVSSTRIAYVLSAGATVSFRLEKASTGRKVGGKCVRRTTRNRRRRACTRYTTLARSFAGPGNTGPNQVALPRIGGRKLGAGLYRLTMTARDAAGKATATTKRFQIKRQTR